MNNFFSRANRHRRWDRQLSDIRELMSRILHVAVMFLGCCAAVRCVLVSKWVVFGCLNHVHSAMISFSCGCPLVRAKNSLEFRPRDDEFNSIDVVVSNPYVTTHCRLLLAFTVCSRGVIRGKFKLFLSRSPPLVDGISQTWGSETGTLPFHPLRLFRFNTFVTCSFQPFVLSLASVGL